MRYQFLIELRQENCQEMCYGRSHGHTICSSIKRIFPVTKKNVDGDHFEKLYERASAHVGILSLLICSYAGMLMASFTGIFVNKLTRSLSGSRDNEVMLSCTFGTFTLMFACGTLFR